MKKLYTLGLGMALATMSFAQTVTINIDGETADITGTTLTLEGGESIHETFDVVNASGVDTTLRIERSKISEITGATDYICWGADALSGTCYPASTVSPNDPWTTPIASTVADGDNGWLSIYYNANGNVGTSTYRYYVVDNSDTRLDSFDVNYTSTVGIEDEAPLEISLYPNPASDIVNIAVSGNENNVNVQVYNVIGEAVLTQNLSSGNNTLNTSNLVGGVYFYSIRRGTAVIETKKLIIKK